MIDGKTLYKNFYWKILQFFISILVNISLVQLFQPDLTAEFYSLVYLFSFASFLTFGLDISLNIFLAKNELSIEKANSICITVIIIVLLLCIPLLYFFYQPLKYSDVSLINFLFFSALQITGGLLFSLYTAVFTAYNKNYIPTIIAFCSGCILLILSIVLRMTSHSFYAIKFLIAAYFLLSFLQGAVLFIYCNQTFPGKRLFDFVPFAQLKRIVRFSFFIFLINFIFFVASRVLILFLPYFFTPRSNGNYIQAFKITEYLGTFAAFIYYPFITIVTQYSEESKQTVLMLIRISNTFVAVFTIFILATGYILFPFVFGRSFDMIYMIFIGFIPGLFASCSSTFFTAYYFGTQNLRYNFISSCVLLLTSLLCFFLFAKPLGIIGVAPAFSAGNLLSFIYDLIIFRRFKQYSIRHILFLQKEDISKLKAIVYHV